MDEGWRDVRRNAKDSVFVKFFEDRANVFRLYREPHPEDSESSEEDVRIRTVRRVIAKGTPTISVSWSEAGSYV